MAPPSNGVPRFWLYQSTTITWPSGLIDGISSRITWSSQASLRGSEVVAKSCTSSIAIWVEPTSVEWIEQVTSTIALPSAISASASAAVRPSGSRQPLGDLAIALEVA